MTNYFFYFLLEEKFGDSCFICLYLYKLVSNTIYISDDVRVV
jgi:hypothetical protein